MPRTLAQLDAVVAQIEQVLSQVQRLDDHLEGLNDAEALRHQSFLGRNVVVQVWTDPNTNERAFWTFDKNNPVDPGDPDYQGSKVLVIASATS